MAVQLYKEDDEALSTVEEQRMEDGAEVAEVGVESAIEEGPVEDVDGVESASVVVASEFKMKDIEEMTGEGSSEEVDAIWKVTYTSRVTTT